ncbi:MAG TPA: hypothetical protein VMS56_05075 [Thermoanaerobaculia bacterium]|nr:hypothetical protein [Thermoanaerobaculia bacterium]
MGEGSILRETTRIDLLVDVLNRSSEPITLRRLTIQSVTGGAWRFDSSSRALHEVIPPGQLLTIGMGVDAVSDEFGSDPSSRVSVRGTAVFESDLGPFRRVFIEPIGLGQGGGTTPR